MTASRLVQSDVQRTLASLPAEQVDLIIADPPYGLSKADWDTKPDYGRWVEEALRVMKPTGTLYLFGLCRSLK